MSVRVGGRLHVDSTHDLAEAPPVGVSVGVASALAVAANLKRTGLVLINLSSNRISFGLNGQDAVLDSGITLTQYGVWEMDEHTFTLGAIHAIASGAASALAVQEFS